MGQDISGSYLLLAWDGALTHLHSFPAIHADHEGQTHGRFPC